MDSTIKIGDEILVKGTISSINEQEIKVSVQCFGYRVTLPVYRQDIVLPSPPPLTYPQEVAKVLQAVRDEFRRMESGSLDEIIDRRLKEIEEPKMMTWEEFSTADHAYTRTPYGLACVHPTAIGDTSLCYTVFCGGRTEDGWYRTAEAAQAAK